MSLMEQFFDTIRSYDLNLFLALHKSGQSSSFVDDLFYFFAKYGILITFLSFIYLIWNKKINALICSLFALFIAGSVDLTIFLFWKRPRPFVAHADLISLNASNFNTDIASFPSSHTYIAFAVATSVFLYGHKKLGIFLFIMSLGIAVGRIGSGLHYPSDTIGGALLGIASGIIAYLLVNKMEKKWS